MDFKSEFHEKQVFFQSIVVCFHRHNTHSEYVKKVLSGVRLDVLMDMMTKVNVDEGEVGGARACCEKNAYIKFCVGPTKQELTLLSTA